MFGQDWQKAEATIVARDTKYNGDGSVSTHTFVADVSLPTGETFRSTVHEPNIALDFWPPNIGDSVSVLVRPKDRKVKFDKDDDRISIKAYHAAQKRAFENAQQQPAGTSAGAWSTSSDLPNVVASALAQLGIVEGSSTQVFTVDSVDAQAAMAAFNPIRRLVDLARAIGRRRRHLSYSLDQIVHVAASSVVGGWWRPGLLRRRPPRPI